MPDEVGGVLRGDRLKRQSKNLVQARDMAA
jgi:hypothetical protein